MIDLGPHAAYIIGAYSGVGAVIVALVCHAVWDARRVEAALSRLEAQGVRRRSDEGRRR